MNQLTARLHNGIQTIKTARPTNWISRILSLGLALSVVVGTPRPSVNAQTPTFNEPPVAPHSILVFPSRSFVSMSGFAASDVVRVDVIQPTDALGKQVTISSQDMTPVDDPATQGFDGIVEINHPGGGCWLVNTPDIRPGDVVRATIVNSTSAIPDQTTVANVFSALPTTHAADGSALPTGTVQVHGYAKDASGGPLPIDQLSQRIVVPGDAFDLNGKRVIVAAVGKDGTLDYDAPGSTNWTATYQLGPADVDRALTGDGRILWLGHDPAALTENTIFENGAGFTKAPMAQCASSSPTQRRAPAAGSETTPPTTPTNVTANVVNPPGNSVDLSWTASTDPADPVTGISSGLAGYGIYRDGQVVATVGVALGTTFTDRNVPPGTFTYTIDAEDAVGNHSAVSAGVTVTTAGNPAPTGPVNDPPVSPVSIIGFPERDFVSTSGFLQSDLVSVYLIRNGQVVTDALNITPQDDPGTGGFDGIVEVNHPGGACWVGVTPYMRPGDILRTVASSGRRDQTTIQNVIGGVPTTKDEAGNPLPSGTLQVHGTAMDENGDPFPLDQIEQRIVARNNLFAFNRKRTLRAGVGADGTLTYDATNNPTGVKWTATYTGLSSGDINLALGAESRILWLGRSPATLAEITIWEGNDPAIAHGAQPPCTAGQEPPDTSAPSVPGNVTATANGRDVAITWTASTDNVGMYMYGVYRDGVRIRNVGKTKTTFTDLGLASGDHTYTVDAADAVGNRSAQSTPATVGVGAVAATITAKPTDPSTDPNPSFSFTSSTAGATFSCSLSTGADAFSACTSPKSYGPLADGTYTFKVAAIDAAGTPGAFTSYTFTLDTTAPTVTLDTKPTDPTNSRTPNFAFSSNETTATFQCSLVTFGSADSYAPCTSPKTFTLTADGTYNFKVKATDTAGNVSTPISYNFAVVTVAATVSIGTKPANPTKVNTPSFTFSSSATSSTFQCSLALAGAPDTYAACTSPKSYTAQADGDYIFKVKGTDAAGNVSAPATYAFTIDTAGPAVSITAKPPTTTNNTSPSFSFSSEAGATFECSLAAGAAADAFAACTSPKTVGPLTDGSYTFKVTATDAAGNLGTATAYTFTVSTTAGAVTIGTKPANPTKINTPSFTFSSATAGSTFECSLALSTAADAFAACTSPKSYAAQADGSYVFKVRALEPSGVVSAPATAAFTIDTVAPTSTITAKPPTPTNNTSPSFSFTSEAGATFECSLAAGAAADAFAACTSPKTVGPLTDGSYTFKVRATDAAGNLGTAAVSTFTVSTTAGAVTIATKPANPTKVNTPSFTFSSATAGSTFECSLGLSAAADAFTACASPKTYAAQTDGSYVFKVRALEPSGVVSTPATAAFTIDTVAPAVAITAGPPAASNNANPSFSFSSEAGSTSQCSLALTGGADAFTTCVSPKSYTGVAPGNYTFKVIATDAAGNTSAAATRAFTIDTGAPVVTITGSPAAITNNPNATFAFSASKPATFQCSLSTGLDAFAACSSPKAYTALASGNYTFKVKATDSAGNVSAPVAFSFVLDTVLPTASTPVATLVNNSLIGGTTTTPVTVTWSGADAGSGLARYELQRSTAGGTFTAVTLASATATTLTQSLTAGTAYVYRVRSIDRAGNASAFATAASNTPGISQETSASIVYTGAWTTGTLTGASGGSVRFGGVVGKSAKFTFTGRNVSWIAARGDKGRADVLIDGVKVATVDLFSTTAATHVVVFARNGLSLGTHTIQINVLGTKNAAATSSRIDIDAFGTLR